MDIVGSYKLSGQMTDHGFLLDTSAPPGSQWTTLDYPDATNTGVPAGKQLLRILYRLAPASTRSTKPPNQSPSANRPIALTTICPAAAPCSAAACRSGRDRRRRTGQRPLSSSTQ